MGAHLKLVRKDAKYAVCILIFIGLEKIGLCKLESASVFN